MYTRTDRDGVRELVEQGAQPVEVLPAPAYDEQHLPGAISLPLAELDRHTSARLHRDEPVIVYCYDYQ